MYIKFKYIEGIIGFMKNIKYIRIGKESRVWKALLIIL